MIRMLSRPSLGGGPFMTHRLGNPFLGQDLEDLVDVESISAEIIDLMGRLPKGVLGQYQAKYDECQRLLSDGGVVGLYRGGRCLKKLYEDIRGEESRQRTTPPTARPPSAAFPWIPVVAVGALGVAAAVYFATR